MRSGPTPARGPARLSPGGVAKAMVLDRPGKPLVQVDRPVPVPGRGDPLAGGSRFRYFFAGTFSGGLACGSPPAGCPSLEGGTSPLIRR